MRNSSRNLIEDLKWDYLIDLRKSQKDVYSVQKQIIIWNNQDREGVQISDYASINSSLMSIGKKHQGG